ncbi:hypothetical protein A3A69_01985 [candidate division WWE3 bacterium RIFCSPLOWO2_01_FULL_37_15]|uniref:MalT-like TPR region domain-containing protein n=1 Tax=candidate division WWE3 bacterium RIFCSPLOWO2_01_FULL_37_15 TaxID=1802622 RepID=A0A1F4UXR6_UNCKA|nr:MAG: hypothetical protein A3A69_01985 [candidate division WWE3 bacterium RIFCSPLOWO2_01_FULL_37_15]
MSVFSVCIQWGEQMREQGKREQALDLFELARDKSATRSDRALAWAHIGLTYWLLRQGCRSKTQQVEYAKLAEQAFEVSLALARESRNRARTVEVMRHIARMRLDMGYVNEALRIGLDAMGHAAEMQRRDLVWFTHLVAMAQIRRHLVGELPRSVPVQWVKREIKDYLETGVLDQNEVAKRAWRNGILRSHQELYGALALLFLLKNYLQARLRLMRHKAMPAAR